MFWGLAGASSHIFKTLSFPVLHFENLMLKQESGKEKKTTQKEKDAMIRISLQSVVLVKAVAGGSAGDRLPLPFPLPRSKCWCSPPMGLT